MVRDKISRMLQRWLARKFTASNDFQLNHGNLLVFPSRYGFWFALLILLLYLLGTNYQNNLILLLAYLLLSVFLLCIWFAWRNLAALQIRLQPPQAVFAGQQLRLQLDITAEHPFQAVQCTSGPAKASASSDQPVCLQWTAAKRGYYPVTSLQLQSDYPLGIIRCWTYLPVQLHYWVYPTPLSPVTPQSWQAGTPEIGPRSSTEHPEQLKAYQQGDPIKRLHWKRLARQPDVPVIRISEQQAKQDPRWLLVPPLQGEALEQCLSEICHQLLELEAKQMEYGLQSPAGDVTLGQGAHHLQQCLQKLALC